jgi:hypothetical protein
MWQNIIVMIILGLMGGAPFAAPADGPLQLTVRVDGRALPLLHHRGTCYVEAEPGREYSIRLTNRSGDRLAVALAVDGLNTIDARHTNPRQAMKWVVDPWETVEISGWQVSRERARRFFFTTEARSYAATLGDTRNLGVISAAVFREKCRPPDHEVLGGAAAPAPAAPAKSMNRAESSASREKGVDAGLSEDLAATGMGRATDHRVTRIRMELEADPCQRIDIRYEYRDALVRLGVLPKPRNPMARREQAHGFESDSYCPERFR